MYSIAIIPSFNYSIIAFSEKEKIVKYKILKNIEVSENLITSIEEINKEDFKINYITIFTGPGTLMTCRSLIAFIKGWSISKEIPIINKFGEKYYIKNNNEITCITLFNNRYLIIKNNEIKILNEIDLLNMDLKNNYIYLAKNSNFKNSDKNLKIVNILFPNINEIVAEAYFDFLNNKQLNSSDLISPYTI